jgi:hypothetical protein
MIRRVVLMVSVVAVTLFSMAGVAGAFVLYDQTDHAGANDANSSAPNFSPSNDFGSGDFDRTADDFTVPTGQAWSINEVDVSGAFSGPAQGVVNVYVYPDAAGKPGDPLFSQTNIAAPGGPNYVVPLTGAPSLTAGTYWITVQQVVGMGGYWSWTTRTVQSGGPARWFGPAMNCPSFSWSPRAECWPGTNPDQIFLLRGVNTSNTVTLAKPKLNKKKGTAILPVTVPGAGELTMSGKGAVAQRAARAVVSKAVTGPGVVNLKVRAKGKSRQKLNRTGKAKLKVTITFTPTAGNPTSKQAKVKLKKQL